MANQSRSQRASRSKPAAEKRCRPGGHSGRLDPTRLIAAQQPHGAAFPLNGHNDIELRGAVDVARLATMLPHALGIRSDTTITSGTIELAGRLQPTAAGQSITGSVRTAQLAATTPASRSAGINR